ncbi:MAG TPA: C39 family peptidase [Verrucomicrobiae bacterium]|nr:C39 family peptidase [Verrucomicrobiae bacterium]
MIRGAETSFRLVLLLLALCFESDARALDARGSRFLGFTSFRDFLKETNATGIILISPEIDPGMDWNELIPSWNFSSTQGELVFDLRVRDADHLTKWYCLGRWASNTQIHSRESVKNQNDDDGNVATDTLEMKRSSRKVQIRVTLTGEPQWAALNFVGLCFSDTKAIPPPLASNKNAWGKTLTVKERSQANYPEGINSWCSPTSTSMLLSFWAARLHRSDLDHDVPEVARGVNDPNWPGTGNWPFNMAYAGAHEGVRAYVTRFSDLSEVETWIEKGIPVALSVSYNLLKGKSQAGSGHLIVCIGFTGEGGPVVNDPGRKEVHQIYRRENLIKAWADSHNTVYLVYPTGTAIPADLYGHWWTDRVGN